MAIKERYKTQIKEIGKYETKGGIMWKKYDVKLQMTGRFAAHLQLPRRTIDVWVGNNPMPTAGKNTPPTFPQSSVRTAHGPKSCALHL